MLPQCLCSIYTAKLRIRVSQLPGEDILAVFDTFHLLIRLIAAISELSFPKTESPMNEECHLPFIGPDL